MSQRPPGSLDFLDTTQFTGTTVTAAAGVRSQSNYDAAERAFDCTILLPGLLFKTHHMRAVARPVFWSHKGNGFIQKFFDSTKSERPVVPS
ncbi:hypothetical protein HPB52_024042 [Rhipicephalus sanguineus]|uniref:Uncharacterized protein n=1 Tax=Rhipicephalus sanguineus TaxID=34632 RepID=A0A9D4SXV5_RHISA|nr:hypothetical protein HPB52_024042 [Rhipicephalus sanguineus]